MILRIHVKCSILLLFILIDLLWTAPELLRDTLLMRKGTQQADVYAFAIICQELILRGLPFCMNSLATEGKHVCYADFVIVFFNFPIRYLYEIRLLVLCL